MTKLGDFPLLVELLNNDPFPPFPKPVDGWKALLDKDINEPIPHSLTGYPSYTLLQYLITIVYGRYPASSSPLNLNPQYQQLLEQLLETPDLNVNQLDAQGMPSFFPPQFSTVMNPRPKLYETIFSKADLALGTAPDSVTKTGGGISIISQLFPSGAAMMGEVIENLNLKNGLDACLQALNIPWPADELHEDSVRGLLAQAIYEKEVLTKQAIQIVKEGLSDLRTLPPPLIALIIHYYANPEALAGADPQVLSPKELSEKYRTGNEKFWGNFMAYGKAVYEKHLEAQRKVEVQKEVEKLPETKAGLEQQMAAQALRIKELETQVAELRTQNAQLQTQAAATLPLLQQIASKLGIRVSEQLKTDVQGLQATEQAVQAAPSQSQSYTPLAATRRSSKPSAVGGGFNLSEGVEFEQKPSQPTPSTDRKDRNDKPRT